MALRDISGVVDFVYLSEYLQHDVQMMDEILSIFQHQAELWGPMLSMDQEGWRDAAHTLKGAAAGIGAKALAAAASEAEIGDEAGAPDRLSRTLSALSAALSDVAAFRHALSLESLKSSEI
jgi:HPt (histidine-containing phosphotransfer) domain-containing protein